MNMACKTRPRPCSRRGVHAYCITIDEQAMEYFPHVFGANSFAVIDKVERLPQKVTEIYGKITY